MKQSQTLKLDPDLIKELKREAKKNNRPFNNYVEHLLKIRKDPMYPVVSFSEFKNIDKKI